MGSDVGSLESGTRPRRAARGVPKHRPSKTQRRGRKRLRRRRRRSSEEEEEDTDEEMGECARRAETAPLQHRIVCFKVAELS